MKKALAFLLTLSMLFALLAFGGQAFADDAAAGEEIGSEMWRLKLLAAAAQDDVEAMAALGSAYYKGEGFDKDLAAALKWLQKAADAGNTDALVTLGTMYLNGEGVEKDAQKAQELFTRATGGSAAPAAEAKADPAKPQADPDKTCLTGKWDEVISLHNCVTNPFILDETVSGAAWVEFTMLTPREPSGYPYGSWYLYARDTKGHWEHVGSFKLDKTMTAGKPVTKRIELDQPSTFTALTFTSAENGMDFTLWRFANFYVDPSCVPESARGQAPDSFEDQIAAWPTNRDYPLTRQSVNYGAYSEPGRIAYDTQYYTTNDNYTNTNDYRPSATDTYGTTGRG